MPLLSIPAADAIAQLRRNAFGRWPDGRRDGRRLEGLVLPDHKPGFHLLTTDRVLTVGSCFARNIEVRLAEMGFRVLARSIAAPEEERSSDTLNDVLNKYNPYSIGNEFRWAFEEPFPEDAFIQLGPDAWHDPHLAGNTRPLTLRRLRIRRAWVTGLFRQLPRCRCVIVTLGLVEAWHDAKLDLYLNAAPPAQAIAAEPERFRLDVLSHEEVLGELERMWTLIRTHGSPKVRVLLTVSPVPLKATYTNADVLVANSYSKATLRSAAGAFAAAHPEVDYFPSYEAATLTGRETAFMEDNRHVAPELVNAILDRVISGYVPGSPVQPVAAEDGVRADLPVAQQVRHHLRMGRPAAAQPLLTNLAKMGGFADQGYDEFGFRYTFGKVLIDVGDPLRALVEIERSVALRPNSAVAQFALARVLMRLQRPLRAERAFIRVLQLDPDHKEARLRLARLQLKGGRAAEAEATLAPLLAQDPEHAPARALMEEARAAAAAEWDAEGGETVDTPWTARLLNLFGGSGRRA